jgi:hypothetical protein
VLDMELVKKVTLVSVIFNLILVIGIFTVYSRQLAIYNSIKYTVEFYNGENNLIRDIYLHRCTLEFTNFTLFWRVDYSGTTVHDPMDNAGYSLGIVLYVNFFNMEVKSMGVEV